MFESVPKKLMCWKFKLQIHMLMVTDGKSFGLDKIMRLGSHDDISGSIRGRKTQASTHALSHHVKTWQEGPHQMLAPCHCASQLPES